MLNLVQKRVQKVPCESQKELTMPVPLKFFEGHQDLYDMAVGGTSLTGIIIFLPDDSLPRCEKRETSKSILS